MSDLSPTSKGEGRDASPAEETVQLIEKAGGQAVLNVGDVSSWSDTEACVQQAIETGEYRVPEEVFSGLEPGTTILWSVEAIGADATRVVSDTFRVVVE